MSELIILENRLVNCSRTVTWEFKAKLNYGHFIPKEEFRDQDFNKLFKFAPEADWNQAVLPSQGHVESALSEVLLFSSWTCPVGNDQSKDTQQIFLPYLTFVLSYIVNLLLNVLSEN